MRDLLDRVHADVVRVAANDRSLAGMGTTLTAAYLTGANLFLAHVGDSRAYLFRGGALEQLTRDQTLVQQLVDQGSIEPEAAARHPLRHVLSHAVGSTGSSGCPPTCTTCRSRTATGCCCAATASAIRSRTPGSDRSCAAAKSPREACDELLAAALDGGGPDNITCLVADVSLQRVGG